MQPLIQALLLFFAFRTLHEMLVMPRHFENGQPGNIVHDFCQ